MKYIDESKPKLTHGSLIISDLGQYLVVKDSEHNYRLLSIEGYIQTITFPDIESVEEYFSDYDMEIVPEDELTLVRR